MAYIVGTDRYQTRMITTSLDYLISKDNIFWVIDSYVESLNLENLGFIEYSCWNRGQSPYRQSDLLKLHIYGYLNKIRSNRALNICYNAQSVVDAKNHFVVDISTTNDINNQYQLYTIVPKASELLGKVFYSFCRYRLL